MMPARIEGKVTLRGHNKHTTLSTPLPFILH